MTPHELDRIVREYYPHADPIMTDIIRASATTGIPLSWGLALIEGESGFVNTFGHDPVRNTKGGRVTRARYRLYKIRRRLGWGMQGVGYTQLTWYAFQDMADKLGGCWRPYPNIVTGFRILAGHAHTLGLEKGAAAFNGTGDAAALYGAHFVARQRQWHLRLTR